MVKKLHHLQEQPAGTFASRAGRVYGSCQPRASTTTVLIHILGNGVPGVPARILMWIASVMALTPIHE
jgi:hypothetical protein